MFDDRLRPPRQRALAPLVEVLAPVPPMWLTVGGLVVGLAAAFLAAIGQGWVALALFAVNRLIDGIDGDLARRNATRSGRNEPSDRGGYVDIVADSVVYAALPVGAALGSDIDHIWVVAALLLASFYLNTITWAYLAAVIEKRGRSSQKDGVVVTTVVMPAGLVEGAETILFFVVMLAVPSWLDWTMGLMAAAVASGAALRFITGQRRLVDGAVTVGRVDA